MNLTSRLINHHHKSYTCKVSCNEFKREIPTLKSVVYMKSFQRSHTGLYKLCDWPIFICVLMEMEKVVGTKAPSWNQKEGRKEGRRAGSREGGEEGWKGGRRKTYICVESKSKKSQIALTLPSRKVCSR